MSRERDIAAMVVKYRARIRAAYEAHSVICGTQREALPQLIEDRFDRLSPNRLSGHQNRVSVHFRAFRRRLREAGRARFQHFHLRDDQAAQGQDLRVEEVQSEGEFGVVHGGELLAADPAMTATMPSSPHRLSETPE